MRTEEKGRYEMVWDCPSCGTARLLGLTHRHCPTCGAPQDATRRYFPPEDEAVAVADHPYQGEDVVCAACDTPNAAKAAFCVGCGSELAGAKTAAKRAAQTAAGGFTADSAADAAREAEEARKKAREAAMAGHAAASGAAPPKKSRGALTVVGGLGCLAIVGAVIIAIGAFVFWKKDAAVVVNGHTWERTIAVETLTPTRDTAWKDAVPGGAYSVACAPEKRDTKKVPDGETCVDKRQDKGDGTFAVVQECETKYREEPVYADRCQFMVDRWTVSATERAGGDSLAAAPTWPTVRIANPGSCVGCQREGARKEAYTVRFVDDASKAAHACELPEVQWRGMAVGTRWASKVGVVSGALDCATIQPR